MKGLFTYLFMLILCAMFIVSIVTSNLGLLLLSVYALASLLFKCVLARLENGGQKNA